MSANRPSAGDAERTVIEADAISVGRTDGPRTRASELIDAMLPSIASPIGLIVLGTVFAIGSPRFLTSTNLLTILNEASIVGILALGMTVVLIVGGIDLSVGAVASLTTVLISQILLKFGMPLEIALPTVLLVGFVIGLANGFVVVKAHVPAIIVTLGTMSIVYAIAAYASGSQIADLSNYGLLVFLGQGYIGPLPVPGILLVLLVLGAQVLFSRSVVFRRLRAIGASVRAAYLMGLPVESYTIAAFAVSGVLAALAGIVLAGQLAGSTPNAGKGLELPAITAAVLGGTTLLGGSGSAIGSLLGALLLATAFDGLILLGFSPFSQQIATGVILALAIALNEWLRRRAV